jgi:hypothetical protein
MVDAGTSHVEPARLVIAWQGRPRAKLGRRSSQATLSGRDRQAAGHGRSTSAQVFLMVRDWELVRTMSATMIGAFALSAFSNFFTFTFEFCRAGKSITTDLEIESPERRAGIAIDGHGGSSVSSCRNLVRSANTR